MEHVLGIDGLGSVFYIVMVALFAGVVKGVVGFAMPMILISGLTLILPPETALAALILPTLLTNAWQSLRQGVTSAIRTVLDFKIFLGCLVLLLFSSAQLVRVLDPRALYALIGIPVTVFSVLLLTGWTPKLSGRSARLDALIGGFAGFIGGVSGVWGPPTVAYLTAVNSPKQDQMRAQGVIYGIGAIALSAAHLQTGVLRAETMPLTLLILPCAFGGLWLGFQIQDRIPQERFRVLTLAVLAIAGLNLIRRAAFG